MPKLCILTQYFLPEMGAPQVRLSELGERLIDRGWEVEVLTALPNYPHGKVADGYDPNKVAVEQIGRIRTVRVPLYTAKSGFLKRLRCYFSFVESAQKHGPKHCTVPDLLIVETPPLFIGYAARFLSKKWKCPFVLNVSDLWPESAIRMGVVKRGLATKMLEWLEHSLYRESIGVTGQSQETVDWIKNIVPDKPVETITNGVDPARFGPEVVDDEAKQLLGNEPGPILIYAGLLGLAQGLDQILDLAKQLPDELPGRFVLIGDGPAREQLIERVQKENITRVKILEAQPRDRIPALLAAADIAIITLTTMLPGAVPSKIYEAMASKLPILLMAKGESVERVNRHQCGLTVEPNDFHHCLEAVTQLLQDAGLRKRLGDAGRQAAETTYHRDHIAEKLDHFLRSLLPESTA